MRSSNYVRSLRKKLFAGFLASAGSLTPGLATAQETQPPELPETRVVAEPATDVFVPDDGLTGTIFDGTVFESPMADGYNASSNTVGGIIDIPNLNFAGTADVVPSAVLLDQQALQFNDILRDIPAAVTLNDPNFPDRFLLRGYEVQSRDFRKDGFIDSTFTPRDFQNIERVEILKGPASILYGGMSTAGTVNLVTKKPLYSSFADGGFTFGSFGLARGTADVNGFAAGSDNVVYRVNASLQNTDSFRNFGYVDRGLIAPTMTWLIDDCTSLTVAYEYHQDDRRPDHGNFALANDPFAFPDEVYFGDPSSDFSRYQDDRISVMLNSQLSDCWTFQIGATGLFYGLDSSQTAAVNPIAPVPFSRVRDTINLDEVADSVIANLAGEFDTGAINHKVVVGTEQVYFLSESVLNQGVAVDLGLFDPNNPTAPAFVAPVFGLNVPQYEQVRNGYYAQDLMQVGDQWYFLAGVRYDHLDLRIDKAISFLGSPFFPVPPTDQSFDRWSPRAGVIYQAIPDVLSFYASYTRSFTPPPGVLSLNGVASVPELGELYEAGYKVQLLDNLTLTACGYHTVRDNRGYSNAVGTFIQDGVERAQGAEVNLLGNITDYWSVIGNYAYSDTRLSSATDPLLPPGGTQSRNVPYNSGNIWTRYNLYDDCEGEVFGLALGLVGLSHRFADLPHTVRLPGFSRWDAGAYYNRGSFVSTLYVENIFDRRYVATSFDEATIGNFPGVNVMPGAPVNFRANVGFIY